MFLHYYGLREQPFGVTPDPRFLYMGAAHQEAYSSLLYGIETGRGFMALIAPPGLGKTTILFRLLEGLEEIARTVFLFQSNATSEQVLRSLISDLGTEPSGHDMGDLQRQFGDLLFREAKLGKRVVVAIDEAQNLDDSVLETVRMLSNYETRQAKLLQIVMAGQPQLATRLASPPLEQLRQRLAIVTRCLPFDAEDVPKYIHHRLRVAGYRGGQIFTPEALQLIVAYSKGVPRSINNVCFQALSLGCAKYQKCIDANTVKEVIDDLSLDPLAAWSPEILDQGRSQTETGVAPAEVPKPAAIRSTPAARQPAFRVANVGEGIPELGLEALSLEASSPSPSGNGSTPAPAEAASPVPAAAGVITASEPKAATRFDSSPGVMASGSAALAVEAPCAADTLDEVIEDLRIEAVQASAPEAPGKRAHHDDGATGILIKPTVRPPGSPNPFAQGPQWGISKVIPLPPKPPAGPVAWYSWAKHRAAILGGNTLAEEDTTAVPGHNYRTPLFAVLFGVVGLIVGVWARPWIKLGSVAAERPSAAARTSEDVESETTMPAPPPAEPATTTPERRHAREETRVVWSEPAPSQPATPRRSVRASLSRASAPLFAPMPGSSGVGRSSSAQPAIPSNSGPSPGTPTTRLQRGTPMQVAGGLTTGRLGVQSNVTGARISIDGRSDFGWTTPRIFTLTPGTYSVSVYGPDGVAWTKAVRVDVGQDQWIVANFDNAEGALLTVETDPPGVLINIDGKPYGQTHVEAVLPAGWHECELFPGPGLRPIIEKVQLKPGEALTRRFVLNTPPASPATGN